MRRSRLTILAVWTAIGASACGGAEGGAPVREAEAMPAANALVAETTVEPAKAAPVSAPLAAEPARDVEAASPAPAMEEQPMESAAEAAAPEQAQTAAAILRRAEAANTAMRSFQADFVQDLTVPLLDSRQRTRGKMYARQPGRFSMRFSDPAGDMIVADGRNVWLYYPSSDKTQVIKSTVASAGDQIDFQKQFLTNAVARYNAVLNGNEAVGGRAANVLTLTPKAAGSGFKKVRVWVDTQDALVRRFEITEENESVRRIELSNLRPNATIPDAIFTFTPPAGTQVFQQ